MESTTRLLLSARKIGKQSAAGLLGSVGEDIFRWHGYYPNYSDLIGPHLKWWFSKGNPFYFREIEVGEILHPWRLTWNIIMEVWKIIFLSKWVIGRFHVNLPGCISFGQTVMKPYKAHHSPPKLRRGTWEGTPDLRPDGCRVLKKR